jgi:hypothetical protein
MTAIDFFKDTLKDNLIEIREVENLYPILIVKDGKPSNFDTLLKNNKQYRKFYKLYPIVLTPEFLQNATDSFPADLLYLKDFSNHIHGEDYFKNINLDNNFLRLNIEREFRSKLFLIMSSSYVTTDKNQISFFLKNLLFSIRYAIYGFVKIKKLNIYFQNEQDLFISILNLLNFDKTTLLSNILSAKGKESSIERFNTIYDAFQILISNIEV